MDTPPPRATLVHSFDYQANHGYAVLGLGGTFQIPRHHNRAEPVWWRFDSDPQWRHSAFANQSQTGVIFAFPVGWDIVRLNAAIVCNLNPHLAADPRFNAPPVPDLGDFDDDDDEDEDENPELSDDELIADQQPGAPDPRFPPGSILTLEVINRARAALGMAILPDPPPGPEVASPQIFTPPVGSAKLWCLTFNGAPVATLEEFQEVARPLLEAGGDALILNIWTAQWQADPEQCLDDHMDSEPVLVACVGFTRIPQPTGAVIAEVVTPLELQEQPVGALIVRAAAGALLSGGMSNHFSFNEQGGLVINPENPPSLDQGYQMMGRVFSTEDTAERLKNFSRWTQGALIAELQRFFGDAFQMDQLCEATERTYNTLNACLNTHLRWAHRKREALSWTHHKEVEFSTLEEPDKEWVLDQSARLGFTVAEQRKLQSHVRVYGRDSIAADLPEDRAAMLERLEVRSVNRNFLFQLGGLNYEYRGPFEHIPNGAINIVNADTKQFLSITGQPLTARTWVPVGVEVPYVRGHAAINAAGVEEARETGEAPRRSTGGRTQTASVPTGPPLWPEYATEAVLEAEGVLNEAIRAATERAETPEVAIEPGGWWPEPVNHETALPDAPEAVVEPTVAPVGDLDYNDLPPLRETHAALHPPRGPVAATQPEDAGQYTYDDRFFNEPGANFLLGMAGYPQGMPADIRDLLDLARTEANAPELLGPHHVPGSAFQAFLEASDDHLIPF